MDFEINAPPEIIAAFREGRRSGAWIEATCPLCGKGPRDRKLRAGIYRGRPWWGCMRCECHKDYQAARKVARLRIESGASDDKKKRERALLEIERSRPLRSDDIVVRYLTLTRDLIVPPSGSWWPSQLLYSSRCWHDLDRHNRYSAMVAVVQNVAGTTVACHRTYLVEVDGRIYKADDKRVPIVQRASAGRLALAAISGCAVRLGVDSEEIGVAEGIESALGFSMHTGLVCWATISANGMQTLQVPQHVRRIIIGPDVGDNKNVGVKAAVALKNRLHAQRSVRVEILPPPPPHHDWNDVYLAGK